MSPSLAVLLLAALAVLPALYAWESARARNHRAAFFAGSDALLESGRIVMTGHAWPMLQGRYCGHKVRLELVLDDMSWRKVPSLWLKATVLDHHPARPVLDFLMRPQGQEFYSPSGEMAYHLPIPKSWPQNAMLCADAAESAGHLPALSPHMDLFEDPRAKELVASPHGVRLVYQAAQADRSRYLVLRQALFPITAVPPDLVKVLLDRALSITAALDDSLAEAPARAA